MPTRIRTQWNIPKQEEIRCSASQSLLATGCSSTCAHHKRSAFTRGHEVRCIGPTVIRRKTMAVGDVTTVKRCNATQCFQPKPWLSSRLYIMGQPLVTYYNVNPGLTNHWLISPFSVDSDHFWREHPPNGVGLLILDQHYREPNHRRKSATRHILAGWSSFLPFSPKQVILWMDTIHFAPKKPWFLMIPLVHTNKPYGFTNGQHFVVPSTVEFPFSVPGSTPPPNPPPNPPRSPVTPPGAGRRPAASARLSAAPGCACARGGARGSRGTVRPGWMRTPEEYTRRDLCKE